MRKQKSAPEEIPQLEGYSTEKRTVSILAANIWALVVLAAMGIVGFVLIYRFYSPLSFSLLLGGPLILAFLLGIVVHELIHGFTWMWATHSGFKHLRFGLMTGAVYCHIDVPMRKRAYVAGALMPLILLGLLPYLVSIFIGSLWLMLFGTLLSSAAMGDVMIVWVIRHESPDTLVYDHPSEAGCLVYRKLTPEL
jgi:hypothetical protein